MIYLSTIISQGTMSYPLCDPVDAVDLAAPQVSFYNQTSRLERILGSVRPYVDLFCAYDLPYHNHISRTMSYHLCDLVDAIDLVGPIGHFL